MAKRRGHGEGSIYLRKDGRWSSSFVLPNGRRQYFYGKTRAEARAKLRAAQRAVEQGTSVETSDESVATYITRWLALRRLELKDGTYAYYRRYLSLYLVEPLGHLPLQSITSEDLQSLYLTLLSERSLSPNTVRLVHTIIHAAFETAVQRKLLAQNPARSVTLPRATQKEMVALSLEQAQQLLAVAHANVEARQIECVIMLALSTGMRRGELMALRWSDIDVARKTLTVNRSVSYINTEGTGYEYKEAEPKTASGRRTIPLPDFVLEALQQHRRDQDERRRAAPAWADRNLVFTTAKGEYLWPAQLVAQFKRLVQEAGLPPMRFHDLRHSAATILLAMGVNAKVIQERLGHAHISITLGRYGHVSESMQREATDKLNASFRPGPSSPRSSTSRHEGQEPDRGANETDGGGLPP